MPDSRAKSTVFKSKSHCRYALVPLGDRLLGILIKERSFSVASVCTQFAFEPSMIWVWQGAGGSSVSTELATGWINSGQVLCQAHRWLPQCPQNSR
ncbi:MAG: hypothetical protein Ct9H300mP16_13050 [Pseudomonadota bacterium]|nr:MAG: hypothetical protein Ct9H300mP16_13050 [Pseudomonadota bacterium]